jgi:hypothetical protein
MKIFFKIILLICTVIIFSFSMAASFISTERELPEELKKESLLKMNNFKGKISNKNLIIIVDYRLSVLSKRLWLYDIEKDSLLLNCHVSHAWNSGIIYPAKFSNEEGSNISSCGSFVTTDDYIGSFGYSMRIEGMEQSNNNAKVRSIVFHPPTKLYHYFYSKGCFIVDREILKKIICLSKNGTLLFVKPH